MSIFAGKTLMITGGTGSFGNAVLNRFLRTDIGEIRIFTRDEKKQDDIRGAYRPVSSHPGKRYGFLQYSVFRNRFKTALPKEPVPPVINKVFPVKRL